MALRPYLKEIADAIREKDGTTEPIPAPTFPDRIRAIESGGGDFAVPLTVHIEEGSLIKAEKGEDILTATSNVSGIGVIVLDSPGEWLVSATKGELYTQKVKVVVSGKEISLTLVAGILQYHGVLTPLPSTMNYPSGASTYDYAIFKTGASAYQYGAYDKEGTMTTLTFVSPLVSYYDSCAVSFGGYAVFAGGYSSTTSYSAKCLYIDNELVAHAMPDLYEVSRGPVGTSIKEEYCVIGGGNKGSYRSGTMYFSSSYQLNIYDKTFTKIFVNQNILSTSHSNGACLNLGNYACFMGGYQTYTCEAYNSDGTKVAMEQLTGSGDYTDGVSGAVLTGDRGVLFGGGVLYGHTTVEIYGSDLVKQSPPSAQLTTKRKDSAAASIGDYVMVAGGYENVSISGGPSQKLTATAEAYDKELLHEILGDLSVARQALAAATVGNYCLMASGLNSSGKSTDTVDAYEIV